MMPWSGPVGAIKVRTPYPRPDVCKPPRHALFYTTRPLRHQAHEHVSRVSNVRNIRAQARPIPLRRPLSETRPGANVYHAQTCSPNPCASSAHASRPFLPPTLPAVPRRLSSPALDATSRVAPPRTASRPRAQLKYKVRALQGCVAFTALRQASCFALARGVADQSNTRALPVVCTATQLSARNLTLPPSLL